MRIIGLDLAIKSAHRAVVLDENGHFVTPSFKVITEAAALQAMLTRAREGTTPDVPLAVAMEPTGSAWQPVAVYLHAHGVTVYVINSQQVASLRKYVSRFAKSDRVDARVLAKAVWLGRDHLVPWSPPAADAWNLQRLCRDSDRLTRQTTVLRNQIRSLDRTIWGAAWDDLFTDSFGPAARWGRDRYYDPAQVGPLDAQTLRQAWQANGLAPTQSAEGLEQLPRYAVASLALYGATFDFSGVQAQVQLKQRLLATLEAEQAQLARQLKQLLQRLDPEGWLESLRGVGPEGAAVYWSFLGDPHRFPTAAQCRSWSGMVPRSAQSSTTEAKGLHISQAGPRLIKKYLFLNADVARRWDPQLAHIYYRQRVEKGQCHTQAVCAVATHLLDRILAVAKEKRPYQLRDVDGRPISRQEARQLIIERYTIPPEVRQRQTKRFRRDRTARRAEQDCLAEDRKQKKESAPSLVRG
jgi:transposase